MQQVISELQLAQVGDVLRNEPLAPYTTWKVGGPADAIVFPNTKQQLMETVRILHRHKTPWFIVGRGSNLLVSDEGFHGAVVKLGGSLEHIRFEGNLVYAGAAYSFIKLSVLAAKEGLTGLEFAGGIPGSVGGAVYMNAGAHGSNVSCVLRQVEVLLETGEEIVLSNEEMLYSYRHSILHQLPGFVTEAVFELSFGDRNEISGAMAAYKDRRLRTQPLQLASAGSVFRNPNQQHAAKLIQDAGMKGMRIGGAEVSTQHANFIVNTGQATARDILNLMQRIQAVVLEKFGVHLIPEILKVGEW